MKPSVLLLLAAGVMGCAGKASVPAASPSPETSTDGPAGATSKQASDDPARALTPDECQSLGEWIAQACQNHENARSAQIDGWCSDMTRGVDGGSWQSGDCAKHVKYMDMVCFRSTTDVGSLMDCDDAVSRP